MSNTTQSISTLNEKIESKIDGDNGPRHAARNSRREANEVAQTIAEMESGNEQAAALSLVHYAALQNVLGDMASDSLQADLTDWSKSELEDQFTAKQLYELIRFTRNHQGWASSLRKSQKAHILRTGFCGSKGESHVDDAEDGVYHPYEADYLRIIHPKSAVKCQNYDEKHEQRSWTTAEDQDCDAANVGDDVSEAATESTGDDTDDAQEAETPREVTQTDEANDVGAAIARLVEDKLDDTGSTDSNCDCDAPSEERIREIAREEAEAAIKDMLGQLL